MLFFLSSIMHYYFTHCCYYVTVTSIFTFYYYFTVFTSNYIHPCASSPAKFKPHLHSFVFSLLPKLSVRRNFSYLYVISQLIYLFLSTLLQRMQFLSVLAINVQGPSNKLIHNFTFLQILFPCKIQIFQKQSNTFLLKPRTNAPPPLPQPAPLLNHVPSFFHTPESKTK
jgi:hypothetical protein